MPEEKHLASMLEGIGVRLDKEQLSRLIWFRDELFRWNRRINLTAITDPLEALEKHLVDSLTLLSFMEEGNSLLDIGSGGGFPSIPLKIARPDWKIWSVDSNSKKIIFQKHIASSLNLSGFTAIHARAESLQEYEELPGFDLITSRAFSSLATTLSIAGPLLAENGKVVIMKGPEGQKELTEFLSAEASKQWVCREEVRLALPFSGAARILLLFVRQEGL